MFWWIRPCIGDSGFSNRFGFAFQTQSLWKYLPGADNRCPQAGKLHRWDLSKVMDPKYAQPWATHLGQKGPFCRRCISAFSCGHPQFWQGTLDCNPWFPCINCQRMWVLDQNPISAPYPQCGVIWLPLSSWKCKRRSFNSFLNLDVIWQERFEEAIFPPYHHII